MVVAVVVVVVVVVVEVVVVVVVVVVEGGVSRGSSPPELNSPVSHPLWLLPAKVSQNWTQLI